MTLEEAKKVIEILATADGGCEYCAGRLLNKFFNEFTDLEYLRKDYEKDIRFKVS